jgi:hypothetical protein
MPSPDNFVPLTKIDMNRDYLHNLISNCKECDGEDNDQDFWIPLWPMIFQLLG